MDIRKIQSSFPHFLAMQEKNVCRSACFTGTALRAWLLLLMLLCGSCGFTQTVGAARVSQGSTRVPLIRPEQLLEIRQRAAKNASAATSPQSSGNVSTPRGLHVPSGNERAARTPAAPVTSRYQYESVRSCTPAGRQEGAPFAPVRGKSDRRATLPGRAPGSPVSRTHDTGNPSKLPVTKTTVLRRPADSGDAAPCLHPPTPPPVKRWQQDQSRLQTRETLSRLQLLAPERPPGWFERVSRFCGEVECDFRYSNADASLKQKVTKEGEQAVLREVTPAANRGRLIPDAEFVCGDVVQNSATPQQPAVEPQREPRSPVEQQKSVHKQQLRMPTEICGNTFPNQKDPLQQPAAASKILSSPLRGALVSQVERISDDMYESPKRPGQSAAQQNSHQGVPQEQQRSGKGKLKASTEEQVATGKKENPSLQRRATASKESTNPVERSLISGVEHVYDQVRESLQIPGQAEAQLSSHRRVPQEQLRSGKGKLKASTEEQVATGKKENPPLQRRATASTESSSPVERSLISGVEHVYDQVRGSRQIARQAEAQQNSHQGVPQEQQRSGKGKLKANTEEQVATGKKENSPLQRRATASKESSSPVERSLVSGAEPVYDDVRDSLETPGQAEALQSRHQHVPQKQQRSGKGKLKASMKEQSATGKKEKSPLQRLTAVLGGCVAPRVEPVYDEIRESPGTPGQAEAQQESRLQRPAVAKKKSSSKPKDTHLSHAKHIYDDVGVS